MSSSEPALVELDPRHPVWERCFLVAPLVLIGSLEETGSHDLAPKHLASPLSWTNHFGFVCTPTHGTYRNIARTGQFTASFPRPDQVVLTGLAAAPRCEDDKPSLAGITVNVGTIDGGLRPNVVAPESSAVIDVRGPTHETAREMEAALHQLTATTPGTRVEVEGRIGRPPMEPTPANREVWALAQRAAEELDLSLSEMAAGGGSDGNTSSQFAPTLDGLGPVGDGAHAPHEFVHLDRMPERAALLARLVACPPLGTTDSVGEDP